MKKPNGTVRDETILLRTNSKVLAVAEAFAAKRSWSMSQLADIALRAYLDDHTADVVRGQLTSEKRAKHATK